MFANVGKKASSVTIIAGRRTQAGYLTTPVAIEKLHKNSLSWQVHFEAKAEARHLPVALASIYAKYVRELFMEQINRYWTAQVPGLRPTAGYYSDGRRFLADIDQRCKRLKTPMRRLLRIR